MIVKRISPIERRIYLQAQGGMPVDCFYHIMAERKDVNRLVVEYEGNSWEDYPDPDYNDPQYGGRNTITGWDLKNDWWFIIQVCHRHQ